MLIKVEGIVAKTTSFGEGDKIVTLITDRYGKVRAMAKGARRTRSKLIAGTQLFCHGEFLLFKGRTWYYIDQVDVINTFYRIRNDLMRLCYGTYLMELISEIVQSEQPAGRLFGLVINALDILCDDRANPELIIRAAEIKALDYAGYRPQLDRCADCGKAEAGLFFSPSSGGIVCSDCRKADKPYGYSISPSALKIMKLLLRWDIRKLMCLKLDDRVLKELERIMRSYVVVHIDKDFTSYRFMDNIRRIK
jgi:DNA repair protein RecO (recombination protein O)